MNTQFEYDAFISYAHADKSIVESIASGLQDRGIKVWYDDWVIDLGGDTIHEVEIGLEKSKTLLLFLSNNSLTSDWVKLERNTAIFRDPVNKERRFVPVLIEKCNQNIPDTIKRYKYLDLTDITNDALDELANACYTQKNNIKRGFWKIKFEGEITEYDDRNVEIL